MRITCPYCGPRSNEEFAYRGDAAMDYVYLRHNPAGPHRELWQHVSACRAWLVVTRDTSTHVIMSVEVARDVARPLRRPAPR